MTPEKLVAFCRSAVECDQPNFVYVYINKWEGSMPMPTYELIMTSAARSSPTDVQEYGLYRFNPISTLLWYNKRYAAKPKVQIKRRKVLLPRDSD